ncbi:MAG: pilus assembly protein CpaD [Xanthobacteraceae bacterium]|nr:MAG: pilus assembly protein CpaD [Xanthobacteraceae bacterium]
MTFPIQAGPARRRIRPALLACIGLAALLAGCKHGADDTTASIPDDYRLRHPITIQEQNRAVEVFIGTARGGLTAEQQAEVGALAQVWRREATGGITIDVPSGTTNARAAADALREIRAIFSAYGVPARSVVVRHYQPDSPTRFATIRINYPKITAEAGPCGLWPEDLGPSRNRIYLENKPYYNLGCATQRNLAAMVENPADLVQPRAETPAYTSRRAVAFDRYRRGTTTATQYPEATQAKISDVGK